MNARTCLLCGKPLSRIWVGAGEDFCSREHRNQYRLRRGMDRLLEANKVATLMRKREYPKPIPEVRPLGEANSRLADVANVRFASNRVPELLPESKWEPPVELPGQQGWLNLSRTHLKHAVPREFGILRHTTPRVILGEGGRRIDPPGANYQERIRHPQRLILTGRNGNPLRVSEGAGFRLPARRTRAYQIAVHTPALLRAERTHQRELPSFKGRAERTAQRVDFTLPNLLGPDVTVPARKTALRGPGAIQYARRVATSDQPLAPRPCKELWSEGEEAMPRPIHHTGRITAPQPFKPLARRGGGEPATPHLALVPLMPQDTAFGYTPAIAPTPVRANGASRASLEEHFDSGLTHWIGSVEDWVLDAAGARTGSLALFAPSLQMKDYELEFLARIEHRSVTWVFRASNLTEYHLATIASLRGGGAEFRRTSVTGGVKAAAVTVPIQTVPNWKNAVTISLRATGKEFSVSLDGQAIDSWTDTRLPVGGIGFVGAPDDRARIYWVRLSPVGSPVKEYPKR